jgi:hypothetical protein
MVSQRCALSIMELQKKNYFVGLLLIGLSIVGCGEAVKMPPLGQVKGVVTMDGQPLANAVVSFEPAKGRPSGATTNAEGKYELIYVETTRGALVGEHAVRITTYVEEGSPQAQTFKETIPKKYNLKSELKENVKAGSNKIDFNLESK